MPELPLSYYVFSAARGNTSLSVSVDGSTFASVTIPDGNYTFATMATALKAALESAHGAGFGVTFDAATAKCTIACTIPGANLKIDTTTAKRTEWGLGYYLGLARGAVLQHVGGAITGAHVASMNPENYLLIDIEELNGISQSALYSAGGSGRRTFAKVPLNGDSYQYNYYDKTLTCVDVRPQLTKLDKLRVSIRFHDGSVVDLNGGEWSMSLEFACTLTRGL